jgi:hypothetical protein
VVTPPNLLLLLLLLKQLALHALDLICCASMLVLPG